MRDCSAFLDAHLGGLFDTWVHEFGEPASTGFPSTASISAGRGAAPVRTTSMGSNGIPSVSSTRLCQRGLVDPRRTTNEIEDAANHGVIPNVGQGGGRSGSNTAASRLVPKAWRRAQRTAAGLLRR
jgi:hypothetical protein